MFKNAILYTVIKLPAVFESIKFNASAFSPCTLSQEKSLGWVAPWDHQQNDMMYAASGQWLFRLRTEIKSVPADALQRATDLQAKQIESTTGRKPGKKERADIKQNIKLEMLVHAFPKQYDTLIWIDTVKMRMVVDTSSQAKADDAITLLMASLAGVECRLLDTKEAPATAMASWLVEQTEPDNFTVDRDCELRTTDESKSVVKYTDHALDIDEVVAHIMAGMKPTQLAMTWEGRTSFVLTEGLQIKKITPLTVAEKGEDESDFPADFALATGSLRTLIGHLATALGGEVIA
jgi:recombination associated protein RdgC